MVATCASCDGFYPWSAALAGALGGIVYMLISSIMVRLKIDDPIDAVAVHGGGGDKTKKHSRRDIKHFALSFRSCWTPLGICIIWI